MRTVLNLGCGNDVMVSSDGQHVTNHDLLKHRKDINDVWDLNVRPWPWMDKSVDLIVAKSVFEHLTIDLVQVLDECWRILRPHGQLHLKVPHWNNDIGYQDPTHRWRFSLHSFDLFDPDTQHGQDYGFYTAQKWKIVSPAILNKAGSSIHVTLEVRK